jgi:hypothetical protein
MNFGLLLTSTLNDKNKEDAKKKFIMKINKFNENKEKEKDDIINKMDYYNNRFQKKRDMNDETYMNYNQSFTQLKENWIKSNKEKFINKNTERYKII